MAYGKILDSKIFLLSPRMGKSEFGQKSYDRLKFGFEFKSNALRNFTAPTKFFFARVAKFCNPCENFHRFVKISCILYFRFRFLFFMFNPLEDSYQTLKSFRLNFKQNT